MLQKKEYNVLPRNLRNRSNLIQNRPRVFSGGWTIGVASLGLNWVWNYNYVQIQVTYTNIEIIPISDTVTAWPLPLAVENINAALAKEPMGGTWITQMNGAWDADASQAPVCTSSHFLLLTNSNIFSDSDNSDIQLVNGYAAKHSLTNMQVNL